MNIYEEADTKKHVLDLCRGEVCVNCCLCAECGRKVGERHLDRCSCSSLRLIHWWCLGCSMDRTVSIPAPKPPAPKP